jgi:2-polyprenyl-6-methoxyphenol hydroxylase-like FAD-dependent oxidoreductase
MSSGRRVLIIGAGLGGVNAALSLRRAGVEVALFEQAKRIEDVQVGIGMILWPNGTRVLELAGVRDDMMRMGNPVTHNEMWSSGGRLLRSYALNEMDRPVGTGTVSFVRGELHKALTERLEDGVLRLGKRCADFSEGPDGVTLHFEDGSEERGDVMVAADGMHSVIRRRLAGVGDDFPPFKYTVWNGVVPFPDTTLLRRGIFYIVFGKGWRFNVYRVDGGERVYWGALGYVEHRNEDPGGSKSFLLDRLSDYMRPMPDLIRITDEAAIGRVNVHGGVMLDRWGEGRTTLLGDAAHPLTTTLGQGAGMSLEDGVILAQELARHDDPVTALREYERRRRIRLATLLELIGKLSSATRQETTFKTFMRNNIGIRLLAGRTMAPNYDKFVSGVVDEF